MLYEVRGNMPPELAEIPYGFKNLWKITVTTYDSQSFTFNQSDITAVYLNGHSVTVNQLIKLYDYNRDGCSLASGTDGRYITLKSYNSTTQVFNFDSLITQTTTFTGVTAVTGEMVNNTDPNRPVIEHDNAKVDVTTYNAAVPVMQNSINTLTGRMNTAESNITALNTQSVRIIKVNDGTPQTAVDGTINLNIPYASTSDITNAVAPKMNKAIAGTGGVLLTNAATSVNASGVLTSTKTSANVETGATTTDSQTYDLKNLLGITALEAADLEQFYFMDDALISTYAPPTTVYLSNLYRRNADGTLYSPTATDKIRLVFAISSDYSAIGVERKKHIAAIGTVTSSTATTLTVNFSNYRKFEVYNQYNAYRLGTVIYDSTTKGIYEVIQAVSRPTSTIAIIPVTNSAYYRPAVDMSIMPAMTFFANLTSTANAGTYYDVDAARIAMMKGSNRTYAGYSDYVEFSGSTIPTQILTEGDFTSNVTTWVTDGIVFTSFSALTTYLANYSNPIRYKMSNKGVVYTNYANGGITITPKFSMDTISAALATAYIPTVSGATVGNFPAFASGGVVADSGKKPADFATAAQGAKADSAVQSVSLNAGSANGTVSITVNGTANEVSVTGLGSAAFSPSTAFATAAQGTRADNAITAVTLASGTNNGTIKVTTTTSGGSSTTDNIAVKGLGGAAYQNTSAFATAAQGAKADTAVQSVSLSGGAANGSLKLNVNGTESTASVTGLGSAAYTATTAYATAAQGTLASTALQPSGVIDNTSSTSATAPLSANQGRILAQRISAISASGKPLGGFATYAARYTNTSQFNPDLLPIVVGDYIYIVADENHTDQPAQYAVASIDASGNITYSFTKIVPDSARDFTANPIQTAEIDDGAVTTVKISDGAITAAKIANNAITTTQLASDINTKLTLATTAAQSPVATTGAGDYLTDLSLDSGDNHIIITKGSAVNAVNVSGTGFVTGASVSGNTLTLTANGSAIDTVAESGTGNVYTGYSALGNTLTLARGNALTGVTSTGTGNVVSGLTVSGNNVVQTLTSALISIAKSGTGNAITGVATDASGNVTLSTDTLLKTLTTSGSGNVVTGISASNGTLTATLGNALTSLTDASTTEKGVVQLNNTLTSTSTAQALTAAQGKALNDSITSVNNAAVHLTGNETIAGTKTISTHLVVPTKSTMPATPSATQYATEAQVNTRYAKVSVSANDLLAVDSNGDLFDTGVAYTSIGVVNLTTDTQTNITGLLKGNGTSLAPATAGTDYTAASHLTDSAAHSSLFGAKADTTALTAHTSDGTIHVTAANKSTWDAKQNAISASGILKGDGNGNITAAVSGTDYAPAYAPYFTLTAATTLTATHYGAYIMANGTFTITMPTATTATAGVEMEIHNVGTGTVTVAGAFLYAGTANASKSFTLAGDEAITVKCVGTGSGAWTIIGAFTEV